MIHRTHTQATILSHLKNLI